jgi:hypothetical protein
MLSIELLFEACQSVPILRLRMRWNRGVAEVEIGDMLLHRYFGLDVSGRGSDRVRDCIA